MGHTVSPCLRKVRSEDITQGVESLLRKYKCKFSALKTKRRKKKSNEYFFSLQRSRKSMAASIPLTSIRTGHMDVGSKGKKARLGYYDIQG